MVRAAAHVALESPRVTKSHMDRHPENKGGLISYDPRFDTYALKVDSNVLQEIRFCPWCAERLPASRRAEWFDLLETMGIDPRHDPIPEAFTTEAWRLPAKA